MIFLTFGTSLHKQKHPKSHCAVLISSRKILMHNKKSLFIYIIEGVGENDSASVVSTSSSNAVLLIPFGHIGHYLPSR